MVLSPHGEMAKTLSVVRLVIHKLLVSVDAVVGVNLFSQPLQTNHHGPPTCNYTGWTFLRIYCQGDSTVLAIRTGWKVPGDLVPQKAPDNSSCWVFV